MCSIQKNIPNSDDAVPSKNAAEKDCLIQDFDDEKQLGLTRKPTADAQDDGRKETTRSLIAQIYVKAFFAVVFVVIFVCCLPIAQGHFKDFQDMLVTVSGILSGPLGFIIGYYFKSGEK